MMVRWSMYVWWPALLTACGETPPSTLPSAPAPAAIESVTSTDGASPPNEAVDAALSSSDAGAASAVPLALRAVKLGATTDPLALDLIAYEPGRSRVWIPASQTSAGMTSVGSVFVFDTATSEVHRIDGFTTRQKTADGKSRTLGPSAAAAGDGVVYIGDRASNEICVVDAVTLARGRCIKLPTVIDAVAYVASAKEVWVTSPDDHALIVLDAAVPGTLKVKTKIKTAGESECTAVDEAGGRFFTNFEDRDETAVIDVKTRKVTATWKAGCGTAGPRGIAFDAAHGFVVVACTDHVQILDAAHDGAALGRLDTGAGVDAIDFREGKMYVAAGKVPNITIGTVDARGQIAVVGQIATSLGARNAVADTKGNAFVVDARGAQLLVVERAP